MTNLHRTNINLFDTDVEYLAQHYGYGWTNKVRDIVHEWIAAHRPNMTLDLNNPEHLAIWRKLNGAQHE